MSMRFAVLLLTLIVGWATDGSSITKKSHNENSPVSDNNSLAARVSRLDRSSAYNKRSKTLACDPKEYSVEEFAEPGTHSVKIIRGEKVIHTIRLLSDEELNGFGFNWAKKTKEGFEISIQHGSVIFYEKTFIFVCTQHKFYLSKIRVDSFDRHHPQKWNRKVIRVRPNLPLEKFFITDFMREGVVK